MNAKDLSTPTGWAPGPARRAIIQIHPSLKCNLSCAHCYSSSSPLMRTEIDPATICDAISDAAAMGYEVVSISGGEPLMYSGLTVVLDHAKDLGMRTTVTTNGFFTRRKELDHLRNLIDVLAISLDGPPEIHNRIRGSERAFQRLEIGLEHVRESGIPFGFIHTATRENWEHLLWLADFAAENGAQLLQIHPLELIGRARSQMLQDVPDDDVLAKMYVLVFTLECKYRDTMKIQMDLLCRDNLQEEPGLVYAGTEEYDWDKKEPANILGLIVLEPNGSVVPVSYGLSQRYKICNVNEQRLLDAWPNYVANIYPTFKDLCLRVWAEVCAPDAPLLTNWHEIIVARSHSIDRITAMSNWVS